MIVSSGEICLEMNYNTPETFAWMSFGADWGIRFVALNARTM